MAEKNVLMHQKVLQTNKRIKCPENYLHVGAARGGGRGLGALTGSELRSTVAESRASGKSFHSPGPRGLH